MKGLTVNCIELSNCTMEHREYLWNLIDYVLWSIARHYMLFDYDDIETHLKDFDSSLTTEEILFICFRVDSILA